MNGDKQNINYGMEPTKCSECQNSIALITKPNNSFFHRDFLDTNPTDIIDLNINTSFSELYDLDITLNRTWNCSSENVTCEVHDYNFWALSLLVFPVLTLFGNVLVIMSVSKERSLQTATNYFIVSLAVADLFVAVGVMPFGVYYLVSCAFLFTFDKTFILLNLRYSF